MALYRRSDHKQIFVRRLRMDPALHFFLPEEGSTASTRNEFAILDDGRLALYFLVHLCRATAARFLRGIPRGVEDVFDTTKVPKPI